MSAQIDVLTPGYVGDRVASTCSVIRDGDVVAVVDPGMVSDRVKILGPLNELGIVPEQVTDVIFSHHHPDHTVNAALFQRARIHDFWATYIDDLWIGRDFENGLEQLSPSVRLLLTRATRRRTSAPSSRPPTARSSVRTPGGTRRDRPRTRTPRPSSCGPLGRWCSTSSRP